ncbi:MAG: Ig-like domain-containing protein [Pseudothermotoga sp.]
MKKTILLLMIVFFVVSCAMLDKIPPTLEVSISKTTDIAGENIILNVSAVDQGGISAIKIYANDTPIFETTQPGQISIKAPYGSFTLTVVAYDKAGNSTSKVIGSFKTRDLTKPKVSIDYTPKGVQPGEQVTVTVSAQDGESGIRVVGLRVNKKDVQLTNNRYTFQAQAGTYELQAYAIDNDGNDNTANVTLNVSAAGDTAGPEIEFPDLVKKARPGTTVNITIQATDESGVSKITFNDGKEAVYVPTTPATQLFWNVARNVGTTSPYSFSVTAYDSRNNYTTKTGSIEIGTNLPPSVSIAVDKPTPKEGEEVTISINATDDSRVTRVVLYIDNVSVRTFTEPPYAHKWSAVKGIHKIKAVATDDSNESTEAFYTVNVGVIDTEAPVIYFTPPYGVPVNKAYTFYAFVTDNVQVQEVTFEFTGPQRKGPIKASTIGGGVFTLTETFTATGTYEAFVIATDSSGNSSSQKGQFPVDEAYIVKAPKIDEFSYAPSVLDQGERVHFKVVARDDLGLSKCDFYVNGIKRDSIQPTVNIFEWDWIATTLGSQDIRVVVVDTEGYTAEATGFVTVVTSRPIARILQPEDGFRTPYAYNMKLSLNAQVIDTNRPSTAYFDVKGPVDERIEVSATGDGPVYTFSAQWNVQSSGEYRIDFFYKNDVNLSDATSVSVNILDLGVVFEQPLPGQVHQCGYDLTLRVRASIYLTEQERFEIKYADRSLTLAVPTPFATSSTYNIYQTTIPSSFFTEPGGYSIAFKAETSKGEEGSAVTTVTVIDTEPPVISEAKINNTQDIVEGAVYNIPMSSSPTILIRATDNRRVANIRLQKKVSNSYNDIATSNTNTLSYIISSLDPYENIFKIVVTDLDNNSTVRNFTIYGYEQNAPTATGFRTMQLYPSSSVYDMNAQLSVQIRGSLNNNTQFKVSDDTGIKEVRLRIIDAQTNGTLYDQTIKKLYEYTTGNIPKELFINNQDVPMFTPAEVGNFNINIEAVDVFGNSYLIAQQQITVEDLTPPIVSLDIPQGKYDGTNASGMKIVRNFTDVKVSFLDNTEPIDKVELFITDAAGNKQKIGEKTDLATNSWTFENISLTSYPDGVTTFEAVATTTSGATGSGQLRVVVDNRRSPIVTIQLPAAQVFLGKAVYRGTVEITAQISGTNVPYDVQKVVLYVDDVQKAVITSPVEENGETKFKFSLNTSIYPNGNHKVGLQVYDHGENHSQLTDSRSYASVVFDNNPPVLLSDAGRLYTNQNTVTLQIDESYGIAEAFMRINDNTINPVPGTLTFEHGLTANTSAPYSLYLKDIAGNVANYSGTLYYDTVQPTLNVQIQPTGVSSATQFTFTLNFSDNLTSVSTLEIQENSTPRDTLQLSWGQTNQVWQYNTPANYEGQRNFSFKLYDRAGNSTTQSKIVDIDRLAPRIDSFDCDAPVFVNNVYYTNSGNVQVSWQVTDTYFSHIVLQKGLVTRIANGPSSGTDDVGLDTGSNTIKLTAYDQVMNKSERTINVVYDTQAPQISNVKIAGNDVTEYATVTLTTGNKSLTFDVNETYIDWSNCEILVDGVKTSSGDDWTKSGTSPNYSVSTQVNIAVDSTIEIVLKDYAGNERRFRFYVDVP